MPPSDRADHRPIPPLRWRAPAARTRIGLAVAALGASGLVTFVCLGAFIALPPRTAGVPVNGAAVSTLVLALGVWLVRSVPFVEIDLQRRIVARGGRPVADLDATTALLLREVRSVGHGTAGAPSEGRSWIVALVQGPPEGAGSEGDESEGDGSEGDGAQLVELRRGNRLRGARRCAARLGTALNLPVFVRDAAGNLQRDATPKGPDTRATMAHRPPTP